MLEKFISMFKEKEDETKEMKMAREKAQKLAPSLLPLLGGKENLVVIDNCTTRLRLEVKDSSIVNEDEIKKLVNGFLNLSKTSVQVIVGSNADLLAVELKRLSEQ
ncbi:MAG: PTS transporter subunit EIIB [Fusobacterium sp.]|nr:PTS transporter subunit EIIB [Fusobacterium sp.]